MCRKLVDTLTSKAVATLALLVEGLSTTGMVDVALLISARQGPRLASSAFWSTNTEELFQNCFKSYFTQNSLCRVCLDPAIPTGVNFDTKSILTTKFVKMVLFLLTRGQMTLTWETHSDKTVLNN